MAVRTAFNSDIEMRKSLPPDFFANIGEIHANSVSIMLYMIRTRSGHVYAK